MTAPTATDNRALADMPLFDTETLKCPYHYDQTLRSESPVYQDPQSGVYIVSTYDLVREAHKNDAVFSNEFTLALGSQQQLDEDVLGAMKRTYNLGKGTLLTVDDPDHKMYRDTVRDFFLKDNVERYRPWIEELAEKSVSALPFGEEFDFVEGFFGCSYAGALAVPATYPKPKRPMPRLSAIATDSRPTASSASDCSASSSGELIGEPTCESS